MWRNDRSERRSSWLWVAVVCAIACFTLATGDSRLTLGSTPTTHAEEITPVVTAVSVSVTTNRALYRPGEQVLVTVRNPLSMPVYAPPRGDCAIVSVWRLQDGQSLKVDACPTLNVTPTAIPGASELTRPLGPDIQVPNPPGPVVIGPVAPSISPELAALPTAVPWKPGDPVREIPEGAVAAPFSALSSDLAPGMYRIELRFALRPGATSDEVQTVHSDPFEVKD
jgi:hypothetical protein